MEKKIKRIGVLTSGGDAPGMNAAVRAVVRSCMDRGIECIGIRRGWSGLINGDIERMDPMSVSHIIDRGGTVLYTARSEEFRTPAGQEKAYNNCKFFGLDGVVAIGGDGTFRGARALSKFGVNVIGIPATIDNDIACTRYCTGCAIRCSPMSAAPSWRSWGAMPGIWPWPSAWPPVRRRSWSPSGRRRSTIWSRRSGRPG